MRRFFLSPYWVPVGIGVGLVIAFIPLDGPVAIALLLLGTSGIAVGVLAAVITWLQSGNVALTRSLATRRGRSAHLDMKWLSSPDEVSAALSYVGEVVGEPPGPSSRQTLRLLLAKNPRLAFGFYTPGETHLVGLIIVYPLNKKAGDHFLNGTLDRSSQLLPEHVCRSWRGVSAVYLSFVGGRNATTKAAVMSAIHFILSDLADSPFFTRPFTPDGRRTATQQRFAPLGRSGLWARIPAGC